jgi:hypothetical protein
MSISFQCSGCGETIKAPDAAAGKRGKCPQCGVSNEIPAPPAEADDGIFDLAPVDEEEERRRREEVQRLIDQERDLLAASGAESGPPLEQRENVDTKDLYHFVVNYCRDMADSNLESAQGSVIKLKAFRALAKEAVGDFLAGKVEEATIGDVPPRVLKGFLKSLLSELG